MRHFTRGVFGIIILTILIGGIAIADPTKDPLAVATDILRKLEQKKNTEVWQTHVSDWFKSKMSKDAFLANMTIVQSQLGGEGSNRQLIQQSTADGDPGTGYTGKVYSFMFSTKFPGSKVYELIVLIREDDAFRVSGINYTPNPN